MTTIYRQKAKSEVSLLVRSMGKALAVTAIIQGGQDEANAYMAKHDDEGLVAVDGDLHFMARMTDRGEKIG